MKNNKLILIAFVFLFSLFSVSFVLGATCNGAGNVINSTTISDGCTLDVAGTYVMSGETFYLNGTDSDGSIEINSNDVILDGNGSTIYYANDGANSWGIKNYYFNNTIIKNITLIEGDHSGNLKYAFYFYRNQNNTIKDSTVLTYSNVSHGIRSRESNNNSIFNNNVSIYGNNSIGIYIQGSVSRSNVYINISNNIIYTEANTARAFIGTYLNDSHITNNDVTTKGESGAGIHIENLCYNNIIDGNKVLTNPKADNSNLYSHGIFLEMGCFYNNITNNNVTTIVNNSHGIVLDTNTGFNLISNNIVNTSNSRAHGIFLLTSTTSHDSSLDEVQNNTIQHNIIYTYFDGYATGIYLQHANATRNILYNNTIETKSYGIYLVDTTSNNITSNNITTDGSSAQGIYFVTSSSNSLESNFIITYGSASRGLRFDSNSDNNVIKRDNIISKSDGIFLRDSNNNSFENVIVNSTSEHPFMIYDGNLNFSIKNSILIKNVASKFYLYIRNIVDGGTYNITNTTINHSRNLGYVDRIYFNNIDGKDWEISNVNQSDFNVTGDYFWLKNINETNSAQYNFQSLSNALIYYSNGSTPCSNINNCDGNINITLQPNNYSYVLDNFNLTDGVTRENSPLNLTKVTTADKVTYQINSTLTDNITISLISSSPCPDSITQNGVSLSFTCSSPPTITTTLASGLNIIEMNYAPAGTGGSSTGSSYNPPEINVCPIVYDFIVKWQTDDGLGYTYSDLNLLKTETGLNTSEISDYLLNFEDRCEEILPFTDYNPLPKKIDEQSICALTYDFIINHYNSEENKLDFTDDDFELLSLRTVTGLDDLKYYITDFKELCTEELPFINYNPTWPDEQTVTSQSFREGFNKFLEVLKEDLIKILLVVGLIVLLVWGINKYG